MATYWANLALAPVNGFSILNHLPSVYVPTRVEDDVLERARAILREQFSSAPLPEAVLQFSKVNTVAELVFFATEWYRLGTVAAKEKRVHEFCIDMLEDKVYPEVRTADFLCSFISRRDRVSRVRRLCPTFGAC